MSVRRPLLQFQPHMTTLATLLTCGLVSACGGGSDADTAPGNEAGDIGGSLIAAPVLRSALTGAQLTAALRNGGAAGQGLLALASGDPSGRTALPCGVQTYHYQYRTIDGRGTQVIASGALMVPEGTEGLCSGARPLIGWAHGTNFNRLYNLADYTDPTNPAASA